MERLGKNKDWLIEQSIKGHFPHKLPQDLTLPALLHSFPLSSLSNISNILKKGGLSIGEALSVVRSYHWFFTDIVSSANPNLTTEEQAKRIVVLNHLVAQSEVFKGRDRKNTLSLSTGDGMAIGFATSSEQPLRLAIEVSRALNYYNKGRKDKVYIRIGLDSGPVFLIRDLNGQLNAWGQGLIMAKRIMDLGGEMHILASDKIVNDIQRLRPEYKNKMELAGYYSVKHDERILVYNFYGNGFGNKRRPDISDVSERQQEEEEDATITKRFLFSSIEVYLDLKDVNTMLMHHRIVWKVINTTKMPIDRIFYFVNGDCPRNFPDLHMSVTDEKNQPLKIIEVVENAPQHKEFFVKANRPINPFEKGRSLTWNYDWEEPKRNFEYQFASRCGRFTIQITVPKSFEINQKVVKLEMATGDKIIASNPALVKYLPDRTVISWSNKNLRAYDAYRFSW